MLSFHWQFQVPAPYVYVSCNSLFEKNKTSLSDIRTSAADILSEEAVPVFQWQLRFKFLFVPGSVPVFKSLPEAGTCCF